MQDIEDTKPAASPSTAEAPEEVSSPMDTASHTEEGTSPGDTPTKSPNEESNKNKSTSTKTNSTTKRKVKPGTTTALKKTYQQLVQDAIVDMKDRTGSSLPAIKKWILTKHPELDGPQFNGRINLAIKNGLSSKPVKFEKIKGSYKIAKEYKDLVRNKKRRVAAAKKRLETKRKEVRKEKRKVNAFEKKLKGISTEEAEKMRIAKEQADARKAAAEAKAKQIAEKLRRRRFPMEDTKLHNEDKEYNIKPPADVQTRPYLPYFWHITVPLGDNSRKSGKTNSSIINASKVDNLEYGTRGLVPDILSIYHFFRGDVHFTLDKENHNTPIVPEFTLQHLIYAVEQILNGNAKKAKQVPPLIVHLFVTCLQILLGECIDEEDDTNISTNEKQLRKEFNTYLLPALTPASWGDVMYLYMDAMDRYYSTDASLDTNVLQSLPTDIHYLLGITDEPEKMDTIPLTPSRNKTEENNNVNPVTTYDLPDGYKSYLGDDNNALKRGFFKLDRQDPWLLPAEELMAMLRSLTEDILATHPAAAADLGNREEAMQELLRAKRSADLKFRKVRIAFEGPKRLPNASNNNKTKETENGKNDVENQNGGNNNTTEGEKTFKPTATKKQFESAKKAMEKANDAYEKAIRNLVARTEPIGYDRHYNAVYCFRHDPEVLYVEDRRPPSGFSETGIPTDLQCHRFSWHVIETTSLFDQFVASLDIRGRREHDLYEEMVGPQGSSQHSLRRYLHDDLKEIADAKAKKKEKENMLERLKVAQIKCDEEQGRRSGRLAGQAETELIAIREEIEELERVAKGKLQPQPRDYDELTGLDVLRKFEMDGRVETRRTREKKAEAMARKLPMMRCSNVCSTGHIDGTGLVGMVVSSMLDLEERCEALVPWERTDISRSTWISRLEVTVSAWNCMSSDTSNFIESGLNRTSIDSISTNGSAHKRRKTESQTSTPGNTGQSLSTILTQLKQPLLDLEARVADLSNVAMATRDADLADDNMSTDSSEDENKKERLEQAWKKLVYKISKTPARKHAQIREMLVAAIGAARKAHLPQVVAQLRAALLQYHPNAASDCKNATVKILEENGGYAEAEDEDDESDNDEAENNTKEEDKDKEEAAPSVISAEAAILRSSLGGSDDARREDWVRMVKSVKTLSRLASLNAAFIQDANKRIEKIEYERDELINAIEEWNKTEERLARQRDGNKKKLSSDNAKTTEGPSEVWANVSFTDEICMAKAEDFPWWPAKKVVAKDNEIAKSLSKLDRVLVGFIGEMGGLRVVKKELIRQFTGELVEESDEVEYSKDIRTQLDDCMTMARRILRGHQRKQKK